jgi:hypothetical protein
LEFSKLLTSNAGGNDHMVRKTDGRGLRVRLRQWLECRYIKIDKDWLKNLEFTDIRKEHIPTPCSKNEDGGLKLRDVERVLF